MLPLAESESAFIGIGSNLGERDRHVTSALTAISALPLTRLEGVSPWYRSTAIGPGEQRDYLNGVAQLRTRLSPHALLDALHDIEQNCGRIRQIRWGPRTIDLDILLFGELVVSDATLIVPHPRMRERGFVLFPLRDLVPDLVLPDGTPVAALCEACASVGLERLDSFRF